MADKRGFSSPRNRGIFNSNTGPSDTRKYKIYILKQPNIDELCRKCGKESETIQHITAACEQLTTTEYVKRYDGLAKVIHQKLAEVAELTEDKKSVLQVDTSQCSGK
jgi:hypothetical protein